jgi:hypothetical protein
VVNLPNLLKRLELAYPGNDFNFLDSGDEIILRMNNKITSIRISHDAEFAAAIRSNTIPVEMCDSFLEEVSDKFRIDSSETDIPSETFMKYISPVAPKTKKRNRFARWILKKINKLVVAAAEADRYIDWSEIERKQQSKDFKSAMNEQLVLAGVKNRRH